jgi:peroxiredoxin
MRKLLMACLTGSLLFFNFSGARVFSETAEKPVYDDPEDVEPLKAGQSVPDGTLKTLQGKEVRLKTLVSQKPTILIFYRGGWCPYCNAQMGQLAKIEPDLEKMGYQLLAISPDKPENLKKSLDRNKVNYTLLSDVRMEVSRRFGLAYLMDEGMVFDMKYWGHDLEKATGSTLHQLPVPAAYVLDTKGVIHFAFYHPDPRIRVKPDKLLKAAKEANP